MKSVFKNFGLVTVIVFLVLAIVFVMQKNKVFDFTPKKPHFWTMQSIDTVKYSRDLAGQYLNDPTFDTTIEDQVSKIAATGATHIALGTPYDARFIPFLKRWVDISRKHGLKVWFRGNFSGWEGWFDFKPITRDEHKALLQKFIMDNGSLFEDGDVFSSCTECENGGPGDPRQNGDVTGHRQFLIDEYQISKNAFRLVGKQVSSNYFPMNFDVANLVMDQSTTQSLGGVVAIDHYVESGDKMNTDINNLAISSGGKIVIGEFGAPIPDIHGNMTEDEQAAWISNTFTLLSENTNVIGVNYWTSFGGSTKLWNDDGSPRKAVDAITQFYSPKFIKGYVIDETGSPIGNVILSTQTLQLVTDESGTFSIPVSESTKITFSKDGYYQTFAQNLTSDKSIQIVLRAKNPNILYRLQKLLYSAIMHL